MIDVKQEFKQVVMGIAYVIVFLTAVRYFKLNPIQVYFTICIVSLIRKLLVKGIFKKTPWQVLKPWIIGCIYVGILFIVMYYLGAYGIVGYFLSCFFIAGWIIYTRWDKYIEIKHHMEIMIWGCKLNEYFKEKKKLTK